MTKQTPNRSRFPVFSCCPTLRRPSSSQTRNPVPPPSYADRQTLTSNNFRPNSSIQKSSNSSSFKTGPIQKFLFQVAHCSMQNTITSRPFPQTETCFQSTCSTTNSGLCLGTPRAVKFVPSCNRHGGSHNDFLNASKRMTLG